MLQSRNLDDQSFDEIVEYAVSRLPWLCPEWTNHNASDPGVTIIELMAWYKEMQQYHMNRFTDDMKLRLLKLVGAFPTAARAAECGVEPERDSAGRPAMTRLETPEGVAFELAEDVPESRPELTACYVRSGGTLTDVSDMLGRLGIVVQPFRFGAGGSSELLLGFDARECSRLRLWVETEKEEEPRRSPFLTPEQAPRVIEWQFEGAGPVQPVYDETHALTVSGYIAFDVPEGWGETVPGEGAEPARYLRAALADPGCEDNVRLTGLSAVSYRAIQRETWAQRHELTVRRSESCCVQFSDALAQEAVFAVFLRTDGGWGQVLDAEEIRDDAGRGVRFDSRDAAWDGDANLMVVCTDPIHHRDLYFDSDGLPGMRLLLALDGRTALPDSFTLICDSLDPDGQIRPAVWRRADDFYGCGPRDRVFVYDVLDESITFGDGRNGAIVPRGKSAVMISSLELSQCSGGNIPAGGSLRFPDGTAVRNTEAVGGAQAESVNACAQRFLAELNRSVKCVSAADYEATARATPGLRVAAVRAIPGYDPAEPSGKSVRPVVTVVVIPHSQDERPAPDERFLAAVQEHMDRRRPICTTVRVVPPKYAAMGVSVKLKTVGAVDPVDVRRCVEEYLSVRPGKRAIGDAVIRGDLAMELQRIPGVLKVGRVELRPLGPECYVTELGNIVIPRSAVAYLGTLDIDQA